jgi:iron complex outermembrane recepter protein
MRLLRPLVPALFAVSCGVLQASTAWAHDVEPPTPLEQPVAAWPDAQPSWHDVVVPVVLLVGADGSVQEASVEASVSPDLDREALAAAKKWVFRPARREGVAIAAKVRAAVRFVGSGHRPGEVTGAPGKSVGAPAVAPTPVTVVGHGEHEHHAHPHVSAGTEATAPTESTEKPAVREVSVQGEAAAHSASEVVRRRDVLRAAPHRTGSDLLLTVPGVFITQHSGEGKAHQIFLRGFDAVHGQDLEIWAGGAPVNDVSNVHGQGYADLHFLMPEVIREVRSTPGTYDPRQGDFAVAGTIRMTLGFDQPGVTTKVTAGSFGSRRLFLGYHPAGEPEGTFAAFETYSTDGFGPQRAASRSSAMGQLLFDVSDRIQGRVLASAYATRFDTAGVVRLDEIDKTNDDAIRQRSYRPGQGGDSSRGQVVLELTDRSGEEHSTSHWSIAPYFVLRSLRLRQDFTGYLQDPEGGDTSQQLNRATTFGFRASYHRKLRLFSNEDTLEAGVSGRQDAIEQSQLRLRDVDDRVSKRLVDAKIRATDVAGYLDAELHPLSRIVLRGGVRADGLAYSTQDFVSGATTIARETTDPGGQVRAAQGAFLGKRGTLDVRVARGLHALVSYGEGFRSPQARSLGDGERAPFTRVVSYEAGVRYRDGQRLEATAAAFHTDLSDDLVFDQETARNERVAATKRNGLTVEGTARPERWLLTTMSVTYTKAQFAESQGIYEAGSLVPYVPQWIARSDLAVTPRLGTVRGRALDGRLGSGLTFLHRRPLPYGEIGHDIFLVDATASLRWGPLEAGLDAFNLLDAQWYDGEFVFASRFRKDEAASLVPQRHVTVGAPRTLLASVAVTL